MGEAPTGIFSDLEILMAIQSGRIVCFPFNQKHIKGSSIDVTLGKFFYLTDRSGNNPYYNPYSEKDVKRYFGECQEAAVHWRWCENRGMRLFDGIPESAWIIVLQPGERILAHTHEFVGIALPTGTTHMHARSTMGRNGIVVCKDAGWGDPGYQGRWTMEIQNDNRHIVPLVVGTRVGQIVFSHTGRVLQDYGKGGKYYRAEALADSFMRWKPEDMLPRLYLDEIEPPVELTEDSVDEYYRQVRELVIPDPA